MIRYSIYVSLKRESTLGIETNRMRGLRKGCGAVAAGADAGAHGLRIQERRRAGEGTGGYGETLTSCTPLSIWRGGGRVPGEHVALGSGALV